MGLQIQHLFAYRLLILLMERVKPTPNLLKIKWHTLLVEMDKVSLLDMDLTGLNNPIIEPRHAQTCQLHAAGTNLTLQDLTLKFWMEHWLEDQTPPMISTTIEDQTILKMKLP